MERCYRKIGGDDGIGRRLTLLRGIYWSGGEFATDGTLIHYISITSGAPAESRRIYSLFESKQDYEEQAGNVAGRVGRALHNEGFKIGLLR